MNFNSNFAFVIDTEQYAGNFEREMCAYVTGLVGECGVGDEFAELFRQEEKIDDDYFENIDYVNDEGCSRPCAIHPTEGWFNHGHGGHFKEGEEVEALKSYKQAIRSYNEPYIKQKEDYKVRLLAGEKISNWTVKACDREIKQHKKTIEVAEKLTKVNKWPAYSSVAIFFYKKPTKEQIELMKRRALQFNETRQKYYTEKYDKSYAESHGQITITGFRLIEQKRKVTEKKL